VSISTGDEIFLVGSVETSRLMFYYPLLEYQLLDASKTYELKRQGISQGLILKEEVWRFVEQLPLSKLAG
jgi:hypothetical protein